MNIEENWLDWGMYWNGNNKVVMVVVGIKIRL